jgi:hypothetical protein
MKSKGTSKTSCTSAVGDAQLEQRTDEADRGRDAKPGAHPVIGQEPGELDEALRQADLFMRLAQRRPPGSPGIL